MRPHQPPRTGSQNQRQQQRRQAQHPFSTRDGKQYSEPPADHRRMIVIPARRMLAPENKIGLVAGHRQDSSKPETKNKESEQAGPEQANGGKATHFQHREHGGTESTEKCKAKNFTGFSPCSPCLRVLRVESGLNIKTPLQPAGAHAHPARGFPARRGYRPSRCRRR